jgi:hypothetical protein
MIWSGGAGTRALQNQSKKSRKCLFHVRARQKSARLANKEGKTLVPNDTNAYANNAHGDVLEKSLTELIQRRHNVLEYRAVGKIYSAGYAADTVGSIFVGGCATRIRAL